jgi:hypothetical protein
MQQHHSRAVLVIAVLIAPTLSNGCDSAHSASSARSITPLGRMPLDVERWVSSSFGGVDVLLYETEDLPLTGQTLHCVKGVDRTTRRPLGGCFDASGRELSDRGARKRGDEERLSRERFGPVAADLRAHLAGVSDVELVPVLIWLKTVEPIVRKEDLIASSEARTAHQATRVGNIEAVAASFRASLPPALAARLDFIGDAPAATAILTASEIASVGRSPTVAQIYYAKPPQPSGTAYPQTVLSSSTGYSGSGESICVLEVSPPTTPNTLQLAGSNCQSQSPSDHARVVAGVIRDASSPYGTATAASVYLTSQAGCSGGSFAGSVNWCVAQGAQAWNYSATCTSGVDRLFDYRVKSSPYPLISVAAGNHADSPLPKQSCGSACTNTRCTPLCASFNTLIVGAANDCGDSTRTNDEIACFSCDANISLRELPHLVAPGQDVTADGLTSSGTSFAAPQVAAAAAQLMQRNNALRSWPEALRSIIMCGATESVSGGPLDQNDFVDDRDGAGELDMLESVVIGAGSNKVDGGNVARVAGHDYWNYHELWNTGEYVLHRSV